MEMNIDEKCLKGLEGLEGLESLVKRKRLENEQKNKISVFLISGLIFETVNEQIIRIPVFLN